MAKFNLTRSLNETDVKALVRIFGCDEADLRAGVTLLTSKAAAEPKPCTCGCGELTKGTWAPGHDSKLHAALLMVIKGQRTPTAGWWDALTPEQALAKGKELLPKHFQD